MLTFKLFCHSLASDWNNENAHFLRGVCSELIAEGHSVQIFEPRNAWSVLNLLVDRGEVALKGFEETYPNLRPHRYLPGDLDLREALSDADVVIVHEWTDPDLVAEIGILRRTRNYLLFFYDTHHRSVTAAAEMEKFDLSNYDGVLAFGEILKRVYLEKGWAERIWVWHEAADTRVFRPLPEVEKTGDLVWIGNWGDDERAQELREFLLEPVRRLGLRANVYGLRYPKSAILELERSGIEFGGGITNYEAPLVYAQHRVTVHLPRKAYALAMPGISDIRVFEALACGIPVISSPWMDSEALFEEDEDFLQVRNGAEMEECLKQVLSDPELASRLRSHGLDTIKTRHTCAIRVQELLRIVGEFRN